MNVPNILTIFRLILIPLLLVAFYLPFQWKYIVTATIFAIASITDLLDGMLARYLSQETELGAFLDPVADKLIVITVIILLVSSMSSSLFTLCAIIITLREIFISALREFLANSSTVNIPVAFIGKFKTTLQMISLILLLANPKDTIWFLIGLFGFYASAIITIISMTLYIINFWSKIKRSLKIAD